MTLNPILLSPLPQGQDYRRAPGLWGMRDQAQSPRHARQSFCQLIFFFSPSYSPSVLLLLSFLLSSLIPSFFLSIFSLSMYAPFIVSLDLLRSGTEKDNSSSFLSLHCLVCDQICMIFLYFTSQWCNWLMYIEFYGFFSLIKTGVSLELLTCWTFLASTGRTKGTFRFGEVFASQSLQIILWDHMHELIMETYEWSLSLFIFS